MTMVVSNLRSTSFGSTTDTQLVHDTNEGVDPTPGRPPQPQFTNIYSPSGFDMLGVLVSVMNVSGCVSH
jgi:hypothetical protein